jgi:hypothetical protein
VPEQKQKMPGIDCGFNAIEPGKFLEITWYISARPIMGRLA